MNEPLVMIAVMACAVAGVAFASAAALRAWTQWLELKHLEVCGGTRQRVPAPDIRELRERVRRLEAIASGES